MPQLSLYLDEKTMIKIERLAQSENQSLSSWVRSRLDTSFESAWPAGYFDLFGSCKKSTLERPSTLSFSKDTKRESL